MKFIINGRTFDTAAAARVAVSRGVNHPDYNSSPSDAEVRFENVLYRTATGAFFVHAHATEKFVKGGRPVVTDTAEELLPAEAVKWITDNGAVVQDDAGLPMPPAAGVRPDEIQAATVVQQSSEVPIVCLIREFGGEPWLWVWPPGVLKNPDDFAKAVGDGVTIERRYRDRFVSLAREHGFERAAEEIEKELQSQSIRCHCVRIGTMH